VYVCVENKKQLCVRIKTSFLLATFQTRSQMATAIVAAKQSNGNNNNNNDDGDTKSYVVIDADRFGAANARPFRGLLEDPKAKNGKKTLHNTFFYIFTATHNNTKYYKAGNSFDPNTYGSKNRFCPFVEYEGLVQVLHYGRAIERFIGYYLPAGYKDSEWFTGCDAQIAAFINALKCNPLFQTEKPRKMVNVTMFPQAFTARYIDREATLAAYLTLFKIRAADKTTLYDLHEANIQGTVKTLTSPFVEKPPKKAAGTEAPATAAPAAPDVASATTSAETPAINGDANHK